MFPDGVRKEITDEARAEPARLAHATNARPPASSQR
jgi:hypothetical protein